MLLPHHFLLVAILLHVRDGCIHQLDTLLGSHGQVSVDLSIEGHLAFHSLLSRQVAEDANADGDDEEEGDDGRDQVHECLEFALALETIKEVLVKICLHPNCITRHGRILSQATANVDVFGEVNRLHGLELNGINLFLRCGEAHELGVRHVIEHAALSDGRLNRPCKSLKLLQNAWDFVDEGVVGDVARVEGREDPGLGRVALSEILYEDECQHRLLGLVVNPAKVKDSTAMIEKVETLGFNILMAVRIAKRSEVLVTELLVSDLQEIFTLK